VFVDQSEKLTLKEIIQIQKKSGEFLYLGRAIDNTIMHALNEINIEATKAKERTREAVNHFLDYCTTNPEPQIIYRASDMQIHIESDAAYLVAPKGRSRAGGYFYLGSRDRNLFNGLIFILAKIIKSVMSSAAEAEVGSLYMNAREAIPLIYTCEELGHIQLPIPIKTSNSTANGIINKEIKLKRAKAFDMRFLWIIDRVEEGLFRIYWAPRVINLADYFTKKHQELYHQKVRPIYLYEEGKSPNSMQGCVEILRDAHAPSRVVSSNRLDLNRQIYTRRAKMHNNIPLPKYVQQLARTISSLQTRLCRAVCKTYTCAYSVHKSPKSQSYPMHKFILLNDLSEKFIFSLFFLSVLLFFLIKSPL